MNPKAYLAADLLAKTILKKPTRDGYGDGVVEAGKKNPNVVVCCADLTESTRSLAFKKAFPERFVQFGVSEQSLAAVAAGMAMAGKVPFISSYAMFSPGRNWEMIRTNIALNNVNVKIMGAHAGVSVGPDGATHQAVEDMAITRVIPRMTVIAPCDMHETRKATIAAATLAGPVYVRFAREKTPVFTTNKTPFKIGRAETFRFGKHATIVACGPLVHTALLAAEVLAKKGIDCEVIDNHTVKPMDARTILASARKTRRVVTVEEHQVHGGMGSRVAEILAASLPVPMEFVGMQDRFGESGNPEELIEHFGMGVSAVIAAVRKVMKRK
ncbi:transketolase family protein [Patescibacteria group bacterium]|nr:MAG: transketolase family protein [Patescibacteria group bacterium]